MHCISQRIENRGVVLRDGWIELPDVRLRDYHVLGEGAIGVDADDFYVLADVRFAGAALQALAAGHMHLGRNKITFLHAGHFVPESGYLAAKLIPRNQWRLD